MLSRLFSFVARTLIVGTVVYATGATAFASSVPAHPRVAVHARKPANSTYSWPMLLNNPAHTSVITDAALSASVDSKLGLNWMSALRSADLGSPVSAFNATLNTTVVYVGDERGDVTAVDESTGATIWSTSVGFGDAERATPLVAPDGSVWTATSYSSSLIKLDGTTGKVLCSVQEPIHIDASPMLVIPKGQTIPWVYLATNDNAALSGPTFAVRSTDCKKMWSFSNYLQQTGGWATVAYGTDKNGRALVFEGTADPDSTEYALDARSGKLVWSYSVLNPAPGTYDIAAAATVSPPGNNGFADGVIYVPSKYGYMYALDLTTGALIWQYNFNAAFGVTEGGRSSAALSGTTMVFGITGGVVALNAVTGALLWHYKTGGGTEVLSSPAIVGAAGDQALAFGDTAGIFHVLSLATGAPLYQYQTGGYITSSPAVINSHVLIDSSDGFLYDFMPGGGNTLQGTTALTSPSQGGQIANPNGTLSVTGTATAAAGLSKVVVSIEAGGLNGSWYNATTGTWGSGPVDNVATVANPGSTNSAWSFPLPVPAAGATYQFFANSVDVAGQFDRIGTQPTFTVLPSSTQPTLMLSTVFVAPGATFTVSASAYAPGETVAYSIQGVNVGSGVAAANGTVPPVTITVPISNAFGLTTLAGTGQTSGLSSTASFNISNLWGEAGYGATRTDYEPNDNVLAQTLQATSHGYVSRAWYFNSGAPVNASPVVAAGTAYVGNDAGQFAAIDTISGAPFWSYTTPSGLPIHAAAAVDVNAGLVLFGADDGGLYSLSAANGTLVGLSQLNGIPTSPAIANGQVYVGTDAGSVDAVNETTGALTWSATLTAAVHSAVAVDPSAGVVVAGDDSGAITALNATTGAILWRLQTGAAVTASPAIQGGGVYVGSNDGKLYAVAEQTGALLYAFSAGAPIRGGAALTPSQIIFGTDGGVMYDLSIASGNIIYENPGFKSPIVGVAGVNQVPWAETLAGNVDGAKTNQNLRVVYTYKTGAALSTAPAIVDGAVYVGAADGGLYAFTPYGFAPALSPLMHLQRDRIRVKAQPARWTRAFSQRGSARATRSFEPFGQRQYPLHLDRAGAVAATSDMRFHGGAVQTAARTYLINWVPAAATRGTVVPNVAALLGPGAALAGSAVDTEPYPARMDDTAVQREIARAIALHHWRPDLNAQVLLVTNSAVTASHAGYCAYHSAFAPTLKPAGPVPYAFLPFDDAASGCGSLAALLHREQAEMRSDPLLNANHDRFGNEPVR